MRDIFTLLLICCHAFPQQYSFKNYTVAHGLGSSSVNHIFQDSRGYIWFATQGGGVSRFNGKEFKSFTKADGLVNNDVTYITEDRSGHLWIATAAGASQFNGSNFRTFSQDDGLTGGVIFAIHADEHNKIWFATKEAGVKIFDGISFDSLTTVDGLPTCEVYCITQDKAGSYWFGLSNGIAKYADGEITSYSDSALVSGNAFFSAHVDDSNTVWFGSIGAGVLRISHDGVMTILELPPPVQNDFIGGITRDQRGNFWLATDHGLLKYDGWTFRLFSEKEGLSVNLSQTVLCDYEGNIWCGTLDGGVNLLSSEAFVHYTDKVGLTSRNVTSILPAGNSGMYYVGTGDGLYIFNPASNPPFRKAGGIPDIEKSRIISMSMDGKGFLWLCTQDGVLVLRPHGHDFQMHKKYEQIAGERLVSPTKIIHDSKGDCWVTTYGSGVFLISPGREICFNARTGFPSDEVLTVFEDSKSTLWFGTQDAGTVKYDGEAFQIISLDANSSNQSVWCITEDGNGNIYLGTGESGIFRFDGQSITDYPTSGGLRSNHITSLAWDKNENCLWIGSEKGLEKIIFDANHPIEKNLAYSEPDGFILTGINHNAISIEQGLVWLGTVSGLWRYDRNQDSPKTTPPKIQLTGIRLFYQNQDWKKFADSVNNRTNQPLGLSLPYKKNHLTFDIQALTTQDALYTFILEGQDETWSSPTTNNEITFSNISPGDYTFKAKAMNTAGESKETISFSFIVNPPWWQTWWFRIAALAAAIGALFFFIKARERVLREQNVRLEETVKQRTLEIEQQKEVVEKTLVEKEGLLHEKEILLKEIHHRVKNNLQTISSMLMLQSAGLKDEQAKKAIAESQSRVRSIALVHQKLYQTEGLEKVELNAFVNDLITQVKSFFPYSKEITIGTDIPETYILIDTAIPLGLMLNELLTNSFKYAFIEKSKGEIAVELKDEISADHKLTRHRRVKLSYSDNGAGFNPSVATGSGATLGLRLVNLLSQQIGASLAYSNSNGSEFIFTFELNV